jgi:hypothetical protein
MDQKDHDEILKEIQEEEEERRPKIKRPKPQADTVLPTFPPKKSKPKTFIAKTGGYVKSADGCAQRGKTRGRMV